MADDDSLRRGRLRASTDAGHTGDPTVRHVSGEAPLDNAGKLVSALPETSDLIVDPLDVLEAQEPHSRVRAFMNDLQNRIVNTGRLAIVHCLDGRDVPPFEIRPSTSLTWCSSLTPQRTVTRSKTGSRFLSSAAGALRRYHQAPARGAVSVDTSRDIA